MSGIQILLLTGIILLSLYFIFRLQRSVLDILLLVIMSCTGIFFIVVPETTNKIAHAIGVGRGADLIFYLSILLFWFVCLKLYSKIRRMERMITEIIRTNAILNAKETKSQDGED